MAQQLESRGVSPHRSSISVITPFSASLCEPDLPFEEYESYQSAPDVEVLRGLVNECISAGNDEEAIDLITQEMIRDNGLSISYEVPLYCLTALWVLARKSEENRRKIVLDGATFETIVEVMLIYTSEEILTRAIGLLWCLSMNPAHTIHVAQSGGIDAILSAMAVHIDHEELQETAFGALKVISSSRHCRGTLHSKRALAIVTTVMEKHAYKPAIQREGCVVLGNLAVSDTDQSVYPVSEKEISVMINGILANPDSLDVHEAAVYTLMRLASSSVNVEHIRRNSTAKLSLELAFSRYPDKVGNNILILLKRLKFELPVIAEN